MNTGVAFSPGAALVALVVLLWPVTGAAQVVWSTWPDWIAAAADERM